MPSRIQIRRLRGWRKPPGAILVGRPGKWGNPYQAGPGQRTTEEAVGLYRRDLLAGLLPVTVAEVRRELAGHDLMCWCSLNKPYHADVLLELANGAALG
jgi:hypothetical protein